MREAIIVTIWALVLTAIICLIAFGAALIVTKTTAVPPCPPPKPEIQLVYIYMMEVPYLESDFRGLLHILNDKILADEM